MKLTANAQKRKTPAIAEVLPVEYLGVRRFDVMVMIVHSTLLTHSVARAAAHAALRSLSSSFSAV